MRAYHSCMAILTYIYHKNEPNVYIYIGKYAIICVLGGMIFHEFPWRLSGC